MLFGTARSAAKPPTLTELFPPGAGRGQTVAVKASGTFDHWPVKAWVEGRGVEIRAEKEKGKLKAVVAADAAPGLRWVRLYDEEGRQPSVRLSSGVARDRSRSSPMTSRRHRSARPHFNHSQWSPRQGGRCGRFRRRLTRGQTLVAVLEAERHLGSPMDAVLQVVSPGRLGAGPE